MHGKALEHPPPTHRPNNTTIVYLLLLYMSHTTSTLLKVCKSFMIGGTTGIFVECCDNGGGEGMHHSILQSSTWTLKVLGGASCTPLHIMVEKSTKLSLSLLAAGLTMSYGSPCIYVYRSGHEPARLMCLAIWPWTWIQRSYHVPQSPPVGGLFVVTAVNRNQSVIVLVV